MNIEFPTTPSLAIQWYYHCGLLHCQQWTSHPKPINSPIQKDKGNWHNEVPLMLHTIQLEMRFQFIILAV